MECDYITATQSNNSWCLITKEGKSQAKKGDSLESRISRGSFSSHAVLPSTDSCLSDIRTEKRAPLCRLASSEAQKQPRSTLNFLLVGSSQCSKMDIIKSIRTWKPLKKSKSQQSYKTTASDSSDNYCLSEPVNQCQENNQSSRTSLESESLYVNVNARPPLEPLSKPPPHFLRPKQPFQGKVNFIDLESKSALNDFE